jgi:prophage regulatory protein
MTLAFHFERITRKEVSMQTGKPSKRILRMQDLTAKVPYSRSTIYSLISQGKFPPPFKIRAGGRAAGWYEATIDEWLEREQSSAGSEREEDDE